MGQPLSVKIENAQEVQDALESQGQKALDALAPVIRRGALKVAARIVRTLHRGGRTGNTYTRPGGKSHQASAPGEPPKSDTGFLASTVQALPVRATNNRVTGTVVISAEYAELLEDGSPGGLIKPRPFIKPSFELEAPSIDEDAARALRDGLG